MYEILKILPHIILFQEDIFQLQMQFISHLIIISASLTTTQTSSTVQPTVVYAMVASCSLSIKMRNGTYLFITV